MGLTGLHISGCPGVGEASLRGRCDGQELTVKVLRLDKEKGKISWAGSRYCPILLDNVEHNYPIAHGKGEGPELLRSGRLSLSPVLKVSSTFGDSQGT